MIRISRAARDQIASLTRHYVSLERIEAVRNLRAAIFSARNRIETRSGLFFAAPRPYPDATQPGWAWLKEGRYWVAFADDGHGPVIHAVFHDSVDIPGRL